MAKCKICGREFNPKERKKNSAEIMFLLFCSEDCQSIYRNRLQEENNERAAIEAEKLKKHFRFDRNFTLCSICIVVIFILIIVSILFGQR